MKTYFLLGGDEGINKFWLKNKKVAECYTGVRAFNSSQKAILIMEKRHEI